MYYEKYIKYKAKYLKLQEAGVAKSDKERHECKPTNKYLEICIPNPKGQYKSKESCMNDCENKYINHQLIKAHIKGETLQFYLFIKDIIQNEKIDVYIKGGNVIGLAILKMIYNKYKNNDKEFKKCFDEFLKLNLVKDWDFASYTKNEITDAYRSKLDSIANKYKLVPRAKTFILYQTKRPIQIEGTALFEISVLDSDAYTKLEIPMTTMKVKVHEYNLKYIFMFAKSFLLHNIKKEEFDLDIIKKMINKINIIVHPHKNGLYDPGKNFDEGGLSNDLVKFINNFVKQDKSLSQFLIIHIQDPWRMLYRLPVKNIPKTEKIKKFIREELKGVVMPNWLMDTDKISRLVKSFCTALGNKLADIGDLKQICEFMCGLNLKSNRDKYESLLSDESKKLLKLIFEPLIKKIGINKIEEYDNDVAVYIKFLVDKKLVAL